MKNTLTAICAGWVSMAAPVFAQSNDAVVVELFTSQGCSSCPAADALMTELSKDPRLLALSLHVDYWDYLGWKDKFASPQFTQRQKAYAHHAKDKMVYTPQAIVQGKYRLIGNRAAELGAAVEKQLSQTAPGRVRLTRNGDMLSIEAVPVGGVHGPIRVQLVRYSPTETVQIERGENSGKAITYTNVVTSWTVVGKWDGATELDMQVPVDGNAGLAVILQAEGPAEIVAAATLR
ncbi:DUF1223 domain-containing protein [Pseudorhodobacter sp. W20_MBD10_FR17]|uniref:DUF1223 domain-containing protein n=1 Tax=Pseudorhodobacter sp. W20_MBD10_FR17 TaxID=3240266 RepID=UPI003F9BF357